MAKLIVDFTDVESGGGRVRIPEGDYRAKVASVKVGTSKQGNTMLTWEFEITEGKYKGKKFRDYTTLNVEAAWKLNGILEKLGLKVPKRKFDLTPVLKKVKGKECGITVTDDEYEGKINSKISDYIDLETLDDLESDEDEDDEDEDDEDEDEDEDDEEEEEEEKPKVKAKKKKGKKKKKEEDEDDEIEDLDLDEL